MLFRSKKTKGDSADSNRSDSSGATKTKSRRPANTAFRQQRLKAWQPILTPKTVLPLFFLVGLIFAPIGGLLLWASSQVKEIVIDYSDCTAEAPTGDGPNTFVDIPGDRFKSSFKTIERPRWKQNTTNVEYVPNRVVLPTRVCSLEFHVPQNIGAPVYLYYRLSNFYQNHRRYVKSYDQDQLRGKFLSNGSVSSSSCDPLRTNGTGFAYYPCGLIANSIFNDTFSSPLLLNPGRDSGNNNAANVSYFMTNKGIAWDSDKDLYGQTAYKWYEVAPPPNWQERYPDGYTEDNPPYDVESDEAFHVWMRTAGLPEFSKLALRNDTDVMKAGTYRIDIQDRFPVTVYGGTKSIVISTRTVMGGKNPFLGIAYIVVGGICVVLGALFTATHLIRPRKLGDHTYLSWNNDAATSATASGRETRPAHPETA